MASQLCIIFNAPQILKYLFWFKWRTYSIPENTYISDDFKPASLEDRKESYIEYAEKNGVNILIPKVDVSD